MNLDLDTIWVYAPESTPRLAYIVQELFPSVTLTTSREDFAAYLGVKICYANERCCNNVLWIVPHGLLADEGIRSQAVEMGTWKNQKIFFTTQGDIPFDMFAASFYLLSRYEEYLPHEQDLHGRYAHTNSLAYREDFLRIPLINEWIALLEQELRERCSRSRFRMQHPPFRFVPTYDVDEAFCYLHQPVWKNVLAFFRDLLLGRFEQVVERGNVYSGRKPDPYDTFDWIRSLHERYALQPIWFLLTIVKRGLHDKNLKASSAALQKIYRMLAETDTCGLHPSWQSGTEESLLGEELKTLEAIIERPVTISRQHYLRFTVPHTFRRLIDAAITDDYSMAYGDVNGFRASYARPFRWFDLANGRATGLVIHPLCFMDATSFFHQHQSAQEAGEELQYFYDTVKRVRGECVILFHNHYVTEQPQWIAWRNMYAFFLEKNGG